MAMGPCDIQNTYIDLTCNKQNMGTEKRQREEVERKRRTKRGREKNTKTL